MDGRCVNSTLADALAHLNRSLIIILTLIDRIRFGIISHCLVGS